MTDSEQAVYDKLKAAGCTVYHKGWPDFLCVSPTGKIFAVEVKIARYRRKNNGFSRRGRNDVHAVQDDPLTPEQEEVMEYLSNIGLNCHVVVSTKSGEVYRMPRIE